MKSILFTLGILAYEACAWGTFGKLTFFDNYVYTWWNWIFVLPLNVLEGQLWPLYWGIVRPIFGH